MKKQEKMTEEQKEIKIDEKQSDKVKDEKNIESKEQKKEGKKKSSKKSAHSRKNKTHEKIKQLQKEYDEIKDKYLRLSAEFDNYRKRTLNEKMDLIKNASEKILIEILPVLDDFERAIQASEKIKEIEAIKNGERLIYCKLKDLIKKQGVTEIEAVGKELDTDYHEALTKIPASDEKMKGKIVDVVEKGYVLNDKVLRFAKVVIGE